MCVACEITYTGKLAVARDILTRVDRHVCCVDRQLYAVLVAPLPAPVCVGRLGSYNTVLYASATDGLVFN